ncbi:MAG: hypothetical protein FWG75_06850 [Cystobacterineae bacterium]|nr:hypothetical protein [Cystobacterineae bacterium]
MLQWRLTQLDCLVKQGWCASLLLCLSLGVAPAKLWAQGNAEVLAEKKREQSAKLEDCIAAIVNGEAILLSQLSFEARLNLIRAGVSPQLLEHIPQESWPALLDMVISHRLWAASSEKAELSIEQLGSVALMGEQLKKAFDSEAHYQAFLQKYEMDSADIQATLERIVRAESNLQTRIRLRSQPNEAEIQKAREASPTLSEMQIRTKLYEEKFKLLSKQELEAQRKKADVRILLKFSAIAAL